MKKIVLAVLAVGIITFSLNAQVIPERKRDHQGMMHDGNGKMRHGRPDGMALKELNLTEAQKQQMKEQRESFRQQMEELKKNDNITVKEWKTRMENLRKEQKTKMENILTTEQKTRLEKMKEERKAMQKVDAKARLEKMKIHLGLSNEQVANIEKNRTEMAQKMKELRDNKSLSDDKKREQMKELMKKQQETMKSVLTEEQLKKWKESHKPGPGKHGRPGHKGPKPAEKEMI